ncbi:U2 snRNP-specific A [Piromyces finnis]|uniref:U2 small nuclear ribonucleoprotein A' n=1 Tax=Piromyces finnis TaxID=1754191 RepID=A0A1Y1VM81_9FUNG|nr:U2 snRNP-specific A [Piromyces finnis]|eukprot:ORX59879.1 U2 snRNP-specific A [Piromyces finnis]
MKLNYDVIESAESYINPINDRELDLTGLKISRIENIAVTKDLNDVINFSDNEISKLENFPIMKRLKGIIAINNRISRIDLELPKSLPNLESLILTNNQIQELGDLDVLGEMKKLKYLSLMDNPVVTKKYYRLFVINRCPSLRLLDFKKVKAIEREEAKKLFNSEQGKELQKTLVKTFEPGEMPKKEARPYQGPSPEEAEKIKEMIRNATTLEEITLLEKRLKSGIATVDPNNNNNDDMED